MMIKQENDMFWISDGTKSFAWCKKSGDTMAIKGMELSYTKEKHQTIVNFLKNQGYKVNTDFVDYKDQV